MRALVMAAAAAGMGVLVGCGSADPPLYSVSGTVTFNGKPVPMGQIYFDPDGRAGNTDGPQGFARIVNGQFTTALEGGSGVRGGAYIIRVQGFDGKVGPEHPYGDALFLEHGEKRNLPAEPSTLAIELPAKKK